MAAAQHRRISDRFDSLIAIFDTCSQVSRALAPVDSGLAGGNRNNPHSQHVCEGPTSRSIWDSSRYLGISSICDDFLGDKVATSKNDFDLLTIILGHGVAKETIDALLNRFGDIPQLLLADFADLARTTGSQSEAAILKAMFDIAMRFFSSNSANGAALSDSDALIRYLQANMGKRRVETFRALFLDAHNRLIADEIMWTGTAREVQVHPREVMRRALEHDASAIVVAHNHPSGVLIPSCADIEITKRLIESATTLGLVVHDHLIISTDSYHSMRIHKSIDPWG